jgi:hypothetical protein
VASDLSRCYEKETLSNTIKFLAEGQVFREGTCCIGDTVTHSLRCAGAKKKAFIFTVVYKANTGSLGA